MAKVRKILRPVTKSQNVTIAQVRAAIRELRAEGLIPPADPLPKKTPSRRKASAKAE